MTLAEQIDATASDATEWRRTLHAAPELLYDLPQTSAFVADRLREFGCDEVATGIAISGVVGVINGRRGPGRSIALRADMDALPMQEQTNLPYASRHEGRMHACGHDGHTAMLLGAARLLADSRDFAGRVVLVFSPAEEGGAGSRKMVEEGLIERFGIDEVYGLHNQPGLPVGHMASRAGPMLAAGDRFVITLAGKGGHAAKPNCSTDQVLALGQLISSLHGLRSRIIDPMDPFVLSLTFVDAGSEAALNVVPATARVGGTMRSMSAETRRMAEARLREAVAGIAMMFNCDVTLDWRPGYPVLHNDPQMTRLALAAAVEVCGAANVDGNFPSEMGSDDFAYLLEKRPGSYVWLGNGDSAALHHPAYDFNDQAIAFGIRYWLQLVNHRLAVAV